MIRHAFSAAAVVVLGIAISGLVLSEAIAAPATQPVSTQPATAPAAINWDAAGKHLGETVTVTGPVMGTHVTTGGKSLVLNVGKDFPDATRFSVMIAVDAKNPVSANTYQGKTVTVTGKIELYRKIPEIKATAADVAIQKP